MMQTDQHPLQAWSKLNKIKCGHIVSLVQSLSVQMSEGEGHSLTFTNLIHQRTALFCLVSRSRSLLPAHSGDCSLKHTQDNKLQTLLHTHTHTHCVAEMDMIFFPNEAKKTGRSGTSSEPAEVKCIPALRSGFLSVFGLSTVVDELASSDVCSDKCINTDVHE